VGWRERDYAKFTDEETDVLYRSSSPIAHSRSARSPAARNGVAVAVALSAALFVLGHVPRGHPLIPTLHFPVPFAGKATRAAAAPAQLGRRTALVGSSFTVRGEAPTTSGGVVVLRGRWGAGPWHTYARSSRGDGSYLLRVRLSRRGLMTLKVRLSGRTLAEGTIRVR
jgi:hypothetical protein